MFICSALMVKSPFAPWFLGLGMDLGRVRLYVLGLILTTLIMSILFGFIFVFIKTIDLMYVILILVGILIVWGINTYYLLRMIDVEERAETLGSGGG